MIDQFLQTAGLQGLGAQAWDWYLNGQSPDQIFLRIQQTPEFETRFPGFNELAAAGKPVSVAQWVSYEATVRGLFEAAGIDPQFYDQPEDIAKFITQNISPAELQQRLQMAQDVVSHHYDTEYSRLNGVSQGDLVGAEFLNPDKAAPILERKYAAAQASTLATQSGYGPLDQTEAERLAATGVSAGQEQQGFGTLASQQELFQPLDSGEQAISRDTQLSAQFNNNAQAQNQIETQRRRRQAQFSEGGSYSSSQAGYSGVR